MRQPVYVAAYHQSKFGKLMAMTVPEIAEAIGRPSDEVLFWVMGMRRYRRLVELPEPTDEGYFRYAIAGPEARA